ncbi:hypothetical protein [Mesorhizobium sp.]|uniref:hypothetical protein n=1 Tax=Mesorhizobium sp. TaxID=1871066 RepID=UPI000FE2BED5|nr:hypothetical protein [Mesorhizobium sp.]RWQ16071.1 MAG: hypothetical protein EOR92_22595 [Mesorhizobium sp.]
MDKVEEAVAFPRFMTDHQLRAYFGLSERALTRLRLRQGFPRKDALVNRTDKKAVDRYFDVRAGLTERRSLVVEDGTENFG